MDVYSDVSLQRLNTFGLKVKAACLVEYDTSEELEEIDFKELPQPVKHIGGGSNLLFEGDFPGTILHSRMRFIRPVQMQEYVLVKVGSGVLWDDLCAWAADHGLWGIENLSLIPGEVGAAAVQNIGAYGAEAADVIESVEVYEPAARTFSEIKAADCAYGYRTSRFKEDWKDRYIVTSVKIRLTKEYSPRTDYGNVRAALAERYGKLGLDNLTPSRVRETVIAIRRTKLPDPKEVGSAGSFFRNPIVSGQAYQFVEEVAARESLGEVPHYNMGDGIKIPAAWLIEKCGWKGRTLGNAGVYPRQALVITNATGEATPAEIIALEKAIVQSVQSKFAITLNPEVEHV